jgi:hypothetical protein
MGDDAGSYGILDIVVNVGHNIGYLAYLPFQSIGISPSFS